MQCSALNSAAKQRGWDTRGPALPRTCRRIVLNTPLPLPANTYLNQATQKNTCQILQPQEIPESKISNPRKSFDHPRRLKSGTPPLRSRLRSLMVCFSRWLKMAIYSVEVSQGLVFCITKVTK